MNAPARLVLQQQAMQAWLLHGDRAVAAHVEATQVREQDLQARLRIYRDGYALRLIEILGNDFPVSKALLGEDDFDALAARYLQAHPSSQPSVRHFGASFAIWLDAHSGVDVGVVELARFEWAQGEVFDAADANAVTMTDIAAWPAQDWPVLQLSLAPHLRILALCGNAAAQVGTHAVDGAVPACHIGAPAHWLLWRHDFDVHWRKLDDDEAGALRAVTDGITFAALCMQLAQVHGDAGALRAASLLKQWIGDGLVAALHVTPTTYLSSTPGDAP